MRPVRTESTAHRREVVNCGDWHALTDWTRVGPHWSDSASFWGADQRDWSLTEINSANELSMNCYYPTAAKEVVVKVVVEKQPFRHEEYSLAMAECLERERERGALWCPGGRDRCSQCVWRRQVIKCYS